MDKKFADISTVKALERYRDFAILDFPTHFYELFASKDYAVVQIHDMTLVGDSKKDIVGFSGCFRWENNEIESLDGDDYSDEMIVYGYQKVEKDGGILDILVREW